MYIEFPPSKAVLSDDTSLDELAKNETFWRVLAVAPATTLQHENVKSLIIVTNTLVNIACC